MTGEIVMDLNQDVWDRLREQGHTVGTPYGQQGGGLVVLVDKVAMSVKDARALAQIGRASCRERVYVLV